MAKQLRMLDQVHIAKPCPADWDGMKGDDQVRHCSMCRLNVYNLSEMSSQEAEAFLQKATGRTCIRYYHRSDGKVMTKDCPRGIRAVRAKAARQFALAGALLLTAIGCGEQGQKIKKAYGLDVFDQPGPVAGEMVMGAMPAPPNNPPIIMGKVTAPQGPSIKKKTPK